MCCVKKIKEVAFHSLVSNKIPKNNWVELLVKFGYSEKATKFEKIFHVKFYVTGCQINPIDVNFHPQKKFDKNSADKIQSQNYNGGKSALPLANKG